MGKPGLNGDFSNSVDVRLTDPFQKAYDLLSSGLCPGSQSPIDTAVICLSRLLPCLRNRQIIFDGSSCGTQFLEVF
jgi:hypothetical protein